MAVAQMEVASRDGCLDTPVGRENPVPPESESGTIEVTFGAVMGKTEKRDTADVEASVDAADSYERTVEDLTEPVTGFVLN